MKQIHRFPRNFKIYLLKNYRIVQEFAGGNTAQRFSIWRTFHLCLQTVIFHTTFQNSALQRPPPPQGTLKMAHLFVKNGIPVRIFIGT